MIVQTTGVCPECGARLEAGQSCQALFDEFLTWEFEDPAYGQVHFLTVAVFMTQHGRYSDEGQRWILEQLRAHLDKGVPVEEIRRRAKPTTNQANRTWKVVRPAGAPPVKRIAWDVTIADVASAHGATLDAADYCAAVREWARATLRQLET
jgi:hypothetical protein